MTRSFSVFCFLKLERWSFFAHWATRRISLFREMPLCSLNIQYSPMMGQLAEETLKLLPAAVPRWPLWNLFQTLFRGMNQILFSIIKVLPMNMVAEIHPLSTDDSLKSHSADGSKNETQRISMASLALARPHAATSQYWKRPKPATKSSSLVTTIPKSS